MDNLKINIFVKFQYRNERFINIFNKKYYQKIISEERINKKG